MIRRLLPLLLLALAGCASAARQRQPRLDVIRPDAWTAGAGGARGEVVESWWDSFGDPELGPLIALAIERNHDLQAAAARLDRAAAEARIAGADLLPAVGLGLSAGRQRENFIGFPFGAGSGVPSATFESFGVSLDASWEVDLWGRIRAGARAAVADLQAVEADLRGARLSIAAQTAKVWFALAEAREQLALAEKSVESFRLFAERVRARYESGIRPALDLRLARSNLASAEALLERRRRQVDATTRQLEVLLGRYPGGTLLDDHPAPGLPETPGPVPAGLPSQLVSRRPDLIAAERRLVAADRRFRAARRALYPRLALTAGGGTASDRLGELLDGDFRVWRLLGNLTRPLFQGGRLRAGVEHAGASGREALWAYVGRVLEAYAEVESALAAEQYLAEQERHLAEAAGQLIAAQRLAEQRYRSGVGIFLVVLESQSRALAAESELLDVRRRRLDNRIDLHLALGGGFAPGPAPNDAVHGGEPS